MIRSIPRLPALLCAALLLAGALNAWIGVRSNFVNSDDVQCVLVADAIRSGNVLLHGWTLAADNFLFADVPLTWAVIVLGAGWREALLLVPFLTYVGILAAGLAIVLQAGARGRGSRLLSLGLLAPLLFAPDAQGLGRYLLVSAQHAGSLLLALLAILIIGTGGSIGVVLAISALLVFSDPFAVVIYLGPAIVFALLRLLGGADPRRSALLLAALVGSLVLAHGAKLALPWAGGFETGPTFSTRLVDAAHWPASLEGVAAGLLSLFGADFFGLGPASARAAKALFHLLLLALAAAFTIGSIRGGIERPRETGVETLLALAIAADVLSCAMSAQFAVALAPFGGEARRYLTPAIVFGTLLVSLRLPAVLARSPTRAMQAAATAALLLACTASLSGAVVHSLSIWSRKPAIAWQKQTRLADWLAARHLTRGVGSYWEASSVTVLSRNRVVVRAVLGIDGRLVPFQWIADRRWYEAPRPEFVVFHKGDEFRIDRAAIDATYGPPSSMQDVDGYTVAVLPRFLAAR